MTRFRSKKQPNKNINGSRNPNYRTGLASNDRSKRPSLYNTWVSMKQRCLNPNNPKFHRYGGRGIKIYEDWFDLKKFYDWAITSGWKQGLSLDRIDNNGDYEPSNCQWLTLSENAKKKGK